MDFDLPKIIMWVLMGGAAVSVVVFIFTLFKGGKRSKRINMVLNKQRGELSRQQLEGLNKQSAARQLKGKQTKSAELINKLYKGLNLQAIFSSEDVRNNLLQAGFRGQAALSIYFAARILGVFGGFALTLFLIAYTWKPFPYPDFARYIFAAIGAYVGFYFPKMMVSNYATKRQMEMNRGFPDALDLMVICVEAGLSIEAAFSRVTDEIMESSPILAQELGLTTAELAYLGDRRKAYANFAARTGLPSAKALATTLIQSEQYGTPVGVALNVLSKEKRAERMNVAEQKAASLPAKLTVPMILFFLPVLFVVVIGPAACQINSM